jgi:hypothetical protein
MHYAQLAKVAQQFVADAGQPVKRVAKMKIKSHGFIILNDQTRVAVHPRDIGRDVMIETNIQNRDQKITFV